MSNKELYVVIALVAVGSFSAMMVWASRHARMISAAREIISRRKAHAFACNDVTTDRCFQKSRFGWLLYLLLFLVLVFAAYQDASRPLRGEQMHAGLVLIMEVCVFALPLLLAVHQWIYRVFVFADHMQIRSFRTRTLRFDQMKNLRLEPPKSSVYIVIEMKDGKEVIVDADLTDLLSFVELLCKKIYATG